MLEEISVVEQLTGFIWYVGLETHSIFWNYVLLLFGCLVIVVVGASDTETGLVWFSTFHGDTVAVKGAWSVVGTIVGLVVLWLHKFITNFGN